MAAKRPRRLTVDWCAGVAAIFGELPPDWRAPDKASLVVAAGHLTWSARFVCPDGAVVTARTRLRRTSEELFQGSVA
jgi:hypothetical protein